MLEELKQVRDWKGLDRWARVHKIQTEYRGEHRAFIICGRRVFVSKTPGGDNRGALNARSQIKRALELGRVA